MNGIDTAVASVLASRIDSLLAVGARTGTAASQADASLNVRTPPAPPIAMMPAPLPASAQTALSAVALTLDAITRSGGEATPALVGQLPLWPAAPAIDIAPLPLFDAGANASQAAGASYPAAGGAGGSGGAGASQGADGAHAAQASNAAAAVVATQVPVAELAAALRRTVDESGLFYESHLAQWLSGQRPAGSLAGEPQNRLADPASQLPLELSHDADDSGSWAQGRPAANSPAAAFAAAVAMARGAPEGPQTQSARFTTFDMATHDIIDTPDEPAHAAQHAVGGNPAGAGEANAAQQNPLSAALHPATIPLVRQQLDLLATGQFRWTGEAWPGARLDWTIEQEGDEWRRSGNGAAAADDDYPWRTRLTLSLPSLGTVDAELTLTGSRLVARVQASPGGAARLAAQGETFRQRLAQAGIELSGLSIREIGGSLPAGGAAAAAAAAASAYARSADGASAPEAADDSFDWDMQ